MISKKTLLAIVFSFTFFSSQAQDPQIQNLAWEVSGDTIFNTISTLSSMERFTYDNDTIVEEYIRSHFETLGYDTIYFQDWEVGATPNVIAEKWGTLYPDSIVVLGAHYDAYAIGAPGADDNASGSSGVMESARVLANSNFEKTIRFILFSGEELGLLGSAYNANLSAQNGEKIKLMINLDMISYAYEITGPTVNVIYDETSPFLYDNYENVVNTYFSDLQYFDAHQSSLSGASDHSSFWNVGYPALFLIDCSDFFSDDFNSYIHTDFDIVGTSANSQYLAESIVKTVVVSLCEYAVYTGQSQSIYSDSKDMDIRVFPNPADDIVYLQLNELVEREVRVQLISSTGVLIEDIQLLSTGFNSASMIDISNYSPGIYVIKAISNSRTYTRKIIVQ